MEQVMYVVAAKPRQACMGFAANLLEVTQHASKRYTIEFAGQYSGNHYKLARAQELQAWMLIVTKKNWWSPIDFLAPDQRGLDTIWMS